MPPKELFEDSEHWYDKEIIQEHQLELERVEKLKNGSMPNENSKSQEEEGQGFVEKTKV